MYSPESIGGIVMAGFLQSRRGVVLGGLAAAGVVAPIALARKLASDAGADSSGTEDVIVATAAPRLEVALWESLVGQSFRIATEGGMIGATLAAVERIPFDAARPEALARDRCFYAYFTVGQSVAPSGQQSYPLLHATLGEIMLFLGRGEDRGNEATLYALFY
jgi:hypothetical protein